jgi:hypothetical protein
LNPRLLRCERRRSHLRTEALSSLRAKKPRRTGRFRFGTMTAGDHERPVVPAATGTRRARQPNFTQKFGITLNAVTNLQSSAAPFVLPRSPRGTRSHNRASGGARAERSNPSADRFDLERPHCVLGRFELGPHGVRPAQPGPEQFPAVVPTLPWSRAPSPDRGPGTARWPGCR